MLAYARLELMRGLRNRSYIVFTLALPVAIYLMNTSLAADNTWIAEGLPSTVQFMISMVAFGAIMTVLSIGPRIARERGVGWLRQLRVTPISAGEVVAAKILVGLLLVLPAIVLVFAAAALVNGVAMPLPNWLAMTLLLWLGSVPFAALGVAIGYTFDMDSANLVNSGALLVLAVFGGLFTPLEFLPAKLQLFAGALPSYHFADLAWNIAASGRIEPAGLVLLALWTAVLTVLALVAYRRAAVTP